MIFLGIHTVKMKETSFKIKPRINRVGCATGVPRSQEKRHPLVPYSRTMTRAPWGSQGGGRFLMSEAPLYRPSQGLDSANRYQESVSVFDVESRGKGPARETGRGGVGRVGVG